MAQQLTPEIGTVPTGGMVSVDVEGRRIAVANVDGTLFAFDDACTHRHCSLAKGRQFDITTGKVLRGPAVQPVHTYRVRLQDGRVEIVV